MSLDHAVDHMAVVPDGGEKLLLTDEASCISNEMHEYRELLGRRGESRSGGPQGRLRQIELKSSKGNVVSPFGHNRDCRCSGP